jgi:hypothetical protein
LIKVDFATTGYPIYTYNIGTNPGYTFIFQAIFTDVDEYFLAGYTQKLYSETYTTYSAFVMNNYGNPASCNDPPIYTTGVVTTGTNFTMSPFTNMDQS